MRTLLCAAVLWLACAAACTADTSRPNILWLVAEDLGPELGCYGTKEVWTPNLDKLAASGVRYDRCYSGMVCSPSRSAFMTGMYATTIDAHNHRSHRDDGFQLPEGVRVLTDWMRDAGYFAANLVKLPPACGFKGTGKTDWNFSYQGRPFDSSDWEDLKTHQPFFAQLNFSEAHRPYRAPKRADPAKVAIPPYYPDHPVTREDWAQYLDAATELDRKIGKVLEQLERDGLADNTVVVFLGDNGQSHVRGKQFCYEEGLHVPLMIRWPTQFAPPNGFKPGTADNRLVASIDLAPTMLAIAGAPKPPRMQGRILFGPHQEPDREFVFGHRDRCDETAMRIRTVRDDRYRYIRNFTPEVPLLAANNYKEKQYPVWNLLKQLNAEGRLTPAQAALCAPRLPDEELYDLQTDPYEIRNLATSSERQHRKKLQELRGVLREWIEETGDQGRFAEPPQVAAAEGRTKPLPASKPASAPPAGSRPNVIFILTDDQGYGDLSCHGNPVLRTPNLDRLHDEGARFVDFNVSPTCSPTRSALMTGRHEFRNGVTHTIYERERLTLSATTIAQVLKDAGYTTGIFGKWHLGDQPEYRPDRRGFDETFIHGAGGIGQTYPGSCGDAPGNTYFNPAILHNGKFVKTEGYCTDVFFRQALKWMAEVKGRQPFYAQIALNAPHEPLQVRPEDEQRYAGKVSPMVAKFFGMIANIDDNVGRLMSRLEEWGLQNNTLVIFMNDNGGTVGVPINNAGMRGRKGTPWLGGTRAASFWRWPGRIKPEEIGALAAHIDFFPTLAELAGATLSPEVRAQVEGRSLVPLLENPGAPWPERLLFTHLGRWEAGQVSKAKYKNCAVRAPRWTMVCVSKTGAKEWQLFDVKSDPGQKTNVAGEFPQVVARLEEAYDGWWDSVQPQLVNENAEPPNINPFKELYWQQFGGGPDEELKKKMTPKRASKPATR